MSYSHPPILHPQLDDFTYRNKNVSDIQTNNNTNLVIKCQKLFSKHFIFINPIVVIHYYGCL